VRISFFCVFDVFLESSCFLLSFFLDFSFLLFVIFFSFERADSSLLFSSHSTLRVDLFLFSIFLSFFLLFLVSLRKVSFFSRLSLRF